MSDLVCARVLSFSFFSFLTTSHTKETGGAAEPAVPSRYLKVSPREDNRQICGRPLAFSSSSQFKSLLGNNEAI